jgi:hypothetical protein
VVALEATFVWSMVTCLRYSQPGSYQPAARAPCDGAKTPAAMARPSRLNNIRAFARPNVF